MIPILPNQPINFVTVQQMYEKTKADNIPLLSNYVAEYWANYLANYERYDRIFNRLYKSYYFFNQDANLTADDVQPDFTESVYDLLIMNDKKYKELYRVALLEDTSYTLTGNYNMTEHKELEDGKTITDALGERVVSNSSTQGAQNVDTTGKVAPYDSEQFSNRDSEQTQYGQRSDSSTSTAEEVTDTHTHAGTEEYTLTREGNDGRFKPEELIDSHIKLWNGFNFYKTIFADICKELLLIDRGYI